MLDYFNPIDLPPQPPAIHLTASTDGLTASHEWNPKHWSPDYSLELQVAPSQGINGGERFTIFLKHKIW